MVARRVRVLGGLAFDRRGLRLAPRVQFGTSVKNVLQRNDVVAFEHRAGLVPAD